MTLHWLDGFRALTFQFWKEWFKHPIEGSVLLLLVFAVAARDFLLWVCMGNRYLEDED